MLALRLRGVAWLARRREWDVPREHFLDSIDGVIPDALWDVAARIFSNLFSMKTKMWVIESFR